MRCPLSRHVRRRHGGALVLLALLTGWSAGAGAAPALSSARIQDLEGLEARLADGEAAAVQRQAGEQAQRLAGGNAADRWARSLYLQLTASAASRQGRHGPAADLLGEARDLAGDEPAMRTRWWRQEAGLRLRAGQTRRGAELLEAWLEAHEGEADDLWLVAQARASLGQWQRAAAWVEQAEARDEAPAPRWLTLAATVYQRTGRDAPALERLEALLAADVDDPARWRRAAGLAQRLGEPGRAAALWEAGWRRGVLAGREDLLQRIRLHLAGGTPARGAELLAAALADGELEDSPAHRRLLAQAWTLARDRDRALTAWREVAEHSDAGADWLRLGQLAQGWGRKPLALSALRAAEARGMQEAEAWRARLTVGTAGDEAQEGSGAEEDGEAPQGDGAAAGRAQAGEGATASAAAPAPGRDQGASSAHTGA